MTHYSLTLPTREFLLELFKKVDKDSSGHINVEELQAALSNGTWKPFNLKTVKLMIRMFDKDNKGQISFDEFNFLWKYVTDWQNCFHSFDKDNSGNIDKDELKTALFLFGYRLSDTLIETLITKFDRHGGGNVHFDDFIECCVALQTLTTAFKNFDTDQDGPTQDGISTRWAIVELQGDLKSYSEANLQGKFIGDLVFLKNGTPALIIGHHLMFGKVANLDKPLLVLEKSKNGDETEYIAKIQIRRKIVFKTRPKPIITDSGVSV